jgi:acyl-CoA thioesterase YciA
MPDSISRLPDRQPILRVMPMPADVNHAGRRLRRLDHGAGRCGRRDSCDASGTRSRHNVAVNSFLFKQPVSVGDVVSFFAEVIDTGRTSIKVRVEVYAERHPAQPITVKVTEAVLTYVAINQHGEKQQLPGVM